MSSTWLYTQGNDSIPPLRTVVKAAKLYLYVLACADKNIKSHLHLSNNRAISPSIPIIAARPLFNSIPRLETLVSSSKVSHRRLVTEITREFSSGVVLHDEKLKSSNERNYLEESSLRDCTEPSLVLHFI